MIKNIHYVNIWRIVRLSLVISLPLAYTLQWLQMISNPIDRTGTDFIHFYSAGKISQTYGFSSAYNFDLHQKIEENILGFPLVKEQVFPYNHVPYLLPLLAIIVDNSYVSSFVRWVIILAIVYLVGSVCLIHSLFQNERTSKAEYLLLIATAISFYPFFVSILQGQDTVFLYLGVALWFVGLSKKKDWLTGLGLALTTIRPHICLFLAIPFLFKNRQIWWRFFVIAATLVIISIALLGIRGVSEFVNVLIVTAGGNWPGTHQAYMLNLLGLMIRTLPFIPENLIRVFAWSGYIIGIGLISQMWYRTKEFEDQLAGISILAALFFAPHLHYHDLALLIIPIFMVIRRNKSSLPLSKLITLTLGLSLVLFISSLSPSIYITLPYILGAVLAWGLWNTSNHALPKMKISQE